MKEKFLQFCQKEGLFESHQKVLLALSGGVDSMTLLDWLYHYQHQLGIDLVLAHVNHHQRMEADQEERGIRELAEAKHLPLKVAHFSGPFSESRARQFRYDFFEKVMKEEACSALVTAHHMDDQAETILMRLIRGSRPRHLKGIPLKQGAYEILSYLKNNNYKIALATSASKERALKQLRYADIEKFFDVIVSRDDVKETKPNPDIFLKAAKKLNVNPNECIVIEDSSAGIKAAFNAGMAGIHVVDLKEPDNEIIRNCYKSFNNLNDIRKEIEMLRG